MTNPSVKQGIKLFKAGDKEKARLVFKAVIKKNPIDETAWFWLAATYKKRANQIKCLQKLLEINPQHQAAREQLEKLMGKKQSPPPPKPVTPQPAPAQEVKDNTYVPRTTPSTPSITEKIDAPNKAAQSEANVEDDSPQWRRAALIGVGIFGTLAVLVGVLFGNALFSTTDINSLFGSWLGSTPAGIQTSAPSPTKNNVFTASPTIEIVPLEITMAPVIHASPHPVSTQMLNIPTAPPLTHDFPCLPQNTERVEAIVVNIIDGDSIEVELEGANFHVRYIGINAPETYPREYFSEEATERNAKLVEGQTVTLVKDISNSDQNGHLLRYVLLEDVFINQELVNDGYALAATFPPDIACAELFMEAQESARLNNKGLWKNIPQNSKTATPIPATPTSRVEQTCPYGCKVHYPGCDIKGNINFDLEKIYHTPGSESYNGTIINIKDGERWFCTAEEAESNGWQPAE